MARIIVPEAEAILDTVIPVLDHGFVRLVDYMGGDLRIVQTARISYAKTTKDEDIEGNRRLIDYLMRHRHTSPFEQVVLTFHLKMPIFVARQLARHRTACLTGDTHLTFDLPGGIKRRGNQSFKRSLVDIYRLWTTPIPLPVRRPKSTFTERVDQNQIYTVSELAPLVERSPENLRTLVADGRLDATRCIPDTPTSPSIFISGASWHRYAGTQYSNHISYRNRVSKMYLRTCLESTGEISHTHITDIWETGVKPVFRVTLEDGKSLKMTKDHLCLTSSGWLTLEQATDLRLNGSRVSWHDDAPLFATNGVPLYQSPEWLAAKVAANCSIAEMATEAGVSYHTIRKWLTINGVHFTHAQIVARSSVTQRGTKRNSWGTHSAETRRQLSDLRSGSKSNFWKGGTTEERSIIGAWTTLHSREVFERDGYHCALCKSGRKLHAHHIDPVWHNPSKGKCLDNLITICQKCHKNLHGKNLDLLFLEYFQLGECLHSFWDQHDDLKPKPNLKRCSNPKTTKLMRHWARLKSIEYVGEEQTYDLSVSGPYHNFVANGFIVHNSMNEVSGRYTELPDEYFVPEPGSIRGQDTTNKQGRTETVLGNALSMQDAIHDAEQNAFDYYHHLLANGVAKELARVVLPVATYTEMYWQMDLHNLFHFLRLRLDAHAQAEIRVYAEAMATCAKAVAPMAYASWEDHVLNAVTFSQSELTALKAAMGNKDMDLGLGKNRQQEFANKVWKVMENA